MNKEELLDGFESGEGFWFRLLRWVLTIVGLTAMVFFASLLLTWPQQAVLGLLMVLMAMWLSRASNSYLITLTLMVMSMFSTFRYACWRIGTTVAFFRDPGTKWGAVDAFFILMLIGAEAYAFGILYLGFMQTIWPLRRAPLPLPDDPEEWPDVDLLIPTYNEPLSVVRYTALAALNIDWPADKLHVYILDDGKREEFRQFAIEAGVGYMTRSDNKHAKAGNINRALEKLDSPYVAIFDCDHVPTRSFMQMTLGWFLRDPKLGMLQTPHHFYSPDPFERNLNQYKVIPNEGELFYGIVQDGNDFWNATFFCGSCAVLRRTALQEIGGIAVETVTEDAHTSLRMQSRGWNTAYINIPQAAGLATERLSGHVAQRIRWARGMVQILRTDNPLTVKGLKWPQRLCYFNAMTHFMYALPRLIFLTAPLIYLALGFTNVPGYWAAILAYALPHLTLSNLTNSRIQGQHRHSFWNEIYETVLSPYILLPTLMALFNPKLGKFNVTAKGGVVSRTFFDARIARPFVVLLGFNCFGLLMVIPRSIQIPGLLWLWDGNHPGTIATNAVWVVFNIIILGVAIAVARESKQQRQHVRVTFKAPVRIRIPGGGLAAGHTIDMSSGGAALETVEALSLSPGDAIKVIFPLRVGDAELPATVVGNPENTLRLQFDPLTIAEEEMLTMVLYLRADTWIGWGEARESDQPMRSLYHIILLSMHGLKTTAQQTFTLRPKKKKKKPSTEGRLAPGRVAGLLLCATLAGFGLSFGTITAKAQTAGSAARGKAAAAVSATSLAEGGPSANLPPGTFKTEMTLKDIGVPETIELRGIDGWHQIYFSLPRNQVVKQASMHLVYHFSPGLIPSLSHIKVMLNGTLFATLPAPPNPGPANAIQEQTITMPAELLARDNQLTFEFIGHYVMTCEDPANTVLWSRVDANSTMTFSGDLLPLTDDLKQMPLPFFDKALTTSAVIPIAFPTTPTQKGLEAAGIVASYFGTVSNFQPMRFPVSIGDLPSGNVVLIGENVSSLPAALNLGGAGGPTLAIRTNPNDPYGKVLIVTGGDVDQTIAAAQALAMNWNGMQGATVQVSDFNLPAVRSADDAPRWARVKNKVDLWDYNTAESLQGDGSVPMQSYFRLPPDLYFGETQNVLLHLDYRYNSIPIGPISTIQVQANGAYLGSVPLTPDKEATKESTANMAIPVVDLRPFSNSLSFQLAFQLEKKGNCQDTTPINMMGAILRSSYIDLRGYPHWAALPNLELFANAGFPFTRFADLNETRVVLPDQPSSQEIEMYLTLMGHFGAQTGYPVLRVMLTGADAMHPGANADFLVIGTGKDNPAIAKLSAAMPVTIEEGGLKVRDTEGFFAPLHNAWWKIRSNQDPAGGELSTAGMPDGLIEEMESPYSRHRTIVLVDAKDGASVDPMMDGFLKVSQSGTITGSVAVVHGSEYQAYRIGTRIYHVGTLPSWTALGLWFMQVPWIIDLAVLAFSFFFAVTIRTWLRHRARRRLQITEG